VPAHIPVVCCNGQHHSRDLLPHIWWATVGRLQHDTSSSCMDKCYGRAHPTWGGQSAAIGLGHLHAPCCSGRWR
jgi:hypothetical protein